MLNWEKRSREIAYLLNPAFCSAVLAIAVDEYYKKSMKDFPFVLSYITLPLLLHKPTRIKIPSSTHLTFSAWLENYPVVRIDYYKNILELKSYINEAILFGSKNGVLEIVNDGIKSHLKLNNKLRAFMNEESQEMKDFFTKSSILGKWFGNLDSPSLIYSLLEIIP